ncbi:MAG: hypothetical protein SFU99_03910 [Saprospiraceae bacterium]|nr:hypothetical protein [Saprospiraceae bacterium]
MGGGKSSSSSDSTNVTTTTTGSATGVVGDVFQGQTVNINQEFPDQIQDVFSQLINLTGQAVNIAAEAGQAALTSSQQSFQTAAQPDVTLVQNYQKQIYYAIAAVALVGAIAFWRKR